MSQIIHSIKKDSDFAFSISRRLQTHQLYLENVYLLFFSPYMNLYDQDLQWVIVISIFIAFWHVSNGKRTWCTLGNYESWTDICIMMTWMWFCPCLNGELYLWIIIQLEMEGFSVLQILKWSKDECCRQQNCNFSLQRSSDTDEGNIS